MSKRTVVLAVLLFLIPALIAGTHSLGTQDDLVRADKEFKEKSYKPALEAYRKVFVQDGRSQEQRGHAARRIGECLEKLKKWDEGLTFLQANASTFAGSIWHARLRAQEGSMRLRMPHYYYKKGDLISRDRWIQGASYHYTYYDDVLNSMKALVEARKFYVAYKPSGPTDLKDEERRARVDEYSQICFDMAAALEAHRRQKGGLIGLEPTASVTADLEKHQIGGDYGTDPQAWFKEAQQLCAAAQMKKREALAFYLEAMYCRRLLEGQRQPEVKFLDGQYVTRCRIGGSDEKPETMKLPPEKNPFLLLTTLLKRFPDVPVADDATFVLAKLQSRFELHVEALKTVEGFKDKFAKSPWRSDVLALIQEITYPRLDAGNLHAFQPGETVELPISSRNIKKVGVTAFELDLPEVLSDPQFLKNSKAGFGKVEELVKVAGSRHLNRESPSFQGTYDTGDESRHLPRSGKMQIKLPGVGAYVIELSADETTYHALVVVSEIAIIRKTTEEEAVVYVGRASDGQPVSDASVLVRQRHRVKGLLGWFDKMTWEQGLTTAEGVFVRKHADSRGQQLHIEAFARNGKNYALTYSRSTYPRRAVRPSVVLYGFTDRPVYRPSQTIEFVGNMRTRNGESYSNMGNESFEVTINDPKGNKIFEQTLNSDDFGVVAGSIKVGDEPPLGQYRISYRHNGRWVGSNTFRIEEYKKPEFEVVVRAPEEAVRAGDRFEAVVHGEYYFGGGVPDAKVAWRVYRERYFPTFNYEEPYAYLYGKRRGGRIRRRLNRELVEQGQGTTDVEGNVRIAIDSEAFKAKYADQDHLFIVEADMTDLSRRTISGSGRIYVPRRGLFAHVRANRGFYRVGEKAGFEIRLQKPDGAPVKSKGQVTVYRVTAQRDGDKITESRTQISSTEGSTDKRGLGKFEWQTDSPGRFAIRYVTEDKWGEPVIGEEAVWVTSPDYRADDFQLNNIEVVTDADEYKPGDTAYLMVNSQFPDSHVMVSVEADRHVFSYEMIKMNGKTAVLSLPILEGYAPNVFVSVTMIHDGKFYVSTVELFVPPTNRFMDVELAFDKDSYLPGEMATLTVESRDESGSGVPAQFSLRVMDKAITYIAQDKTPDIRKFFYGRRRAHYGGSRWNSITTNSGQFRFQGHLVRNRTWRRYRQHGMPAGYDLDLSLTGQMYREGKRGKSNWGRDLGLLESASADEVEEELEETDDMAGGNPSPDARAFGRRVGSPAPTGSAVAKKRVRSSLDGGAPESQGALGNNIDPEIRENFSDLAQWQAQLRTGADGKASVSFRLPDSLTTWVATLRGLTRDTKVGTAESEVKTTKNILVRLQAPRFFTERDEILVSGIVQNKFAESVTAKVSLGLVGRTLAIDGPLEREITVPARGELRVDWLARVQESGEARLTLKALNDRESDAMRMSFPVLTYGIDKVVTKAAVIHGTNGSAAFPVDVPAERRVGTTEMELTLNPSLATTLLEALPYLIEYPYGCTEQTMSRFLPAVVVARTLKDMGISLDDIAARRKDLEQRDQLNVGRAVPVYSQYELDHVVKGGLRRLAAMQNSDGGFGWWRSDRSSMHLTSYVLHGLAEAKNVGYDVPTAMIKRAADWLEGRVKTNRSAHVLSYAAFALVTAGREPGDLLDHVFSVRDDLSTQCKAQLALALHRAGAQERAALVMRNLNDFVQTDVKNGLAWWHGGSRWWYWYDDEIETNAYMLLAMSEIAPADKNIEALSRWVIFNRSGNRWKSTRDTATAVLALAHYVKAAGELSPDYEVAVKLGDQEIRRVKINAENMFLFDNKVIVKGDGIPTGELPLTVSKIGKGKLYATCRVKFFSMEDKIEAAGYQIEVERRYFALKPIEKMTEVNGVARKQLDYERTEIQHLGQVPAGTEVEVKLLVTSANNYEYIMLEDRKPAGFEPVALVSGRRHGNGVCSNMELRDEKVVFFVTWLQKGTHEISYRMRAEVPGTINAMPCRAEAMYAPKLGGISASWRVKVTEEIR